MSNATTLKQLQKLAAGLANAGDALQRAAEESAKRLGEMTDTNIAAEKNPWGRSWKKLSSSTIKKKGSSKILYDSGALLASVSVKADGLTIKVSANVPYAPYVLRGTPTIRARVILPRKAIPKSWTKTIEESLTSAVEKEVKA